MSHRSKPGQSIAQYFRLSTYNPKMLLIVFLVVIVALQIDVGIGNIADIVSKQAVTASGIALFTLIAAIFVVGQYLILEIIKTKNKEFYASSPHGKKLERLVTGLQYALAAIMVFTVLQILVSSQYYTQLLSVATAISYGLASCLMTFLAYRLFSWFKLNRNLTVLLYALASSAIAINAVDSIVYFDAILFGKPPTVSPQSQVIFQTGFYPWTPMWAVNLLQSYSLSAYFLLTWAGTILLLRHNIQRLGRVKFWALVILPVVYFLSYEFGYYQALFPSSPVTTAISSSLMLPILLYTYSANVGGFLFGIGFRSISRSLEQRSHTRDYMIVTAYGFMLYFTAGGATVLQAGYPPFGLASVSFVGLASFLILVGLYQSAVSVAQDAKLRRAIKSSVMQQSSKLLESIGTAQMSKQIEENVIRVAKDNAFLLKEESGVEPTLTDAEITKYMDEVLNEIKAIRKK